MSAPTLSRAVLSLDGRRAPRGSTRDYLLHQLVADLFPDRTDRGYLFRETRPRPCGAELLVLSDVPPRDLGEVPVHPWGCAVDVASKPFMPRLASGMRLDFEVRVNATRVVSGPDLDRRGKPKRRRHDVWDVVWGAEKTTTRSPADVYRAWMAQQLDGAAVVEETRVLDRGEVRALRAGRGPITFIATNVAGSLVVADPDALLARVHAGLGRAKAFGCGLLCLSLPGTVLRRLGGSP
jgi:CRISPR system Cascade subunit CasE